MSKPTLRVVISQTIVSTKFDYESGLDLPIRVEDRLNPTAIESIAKSVREYFRRQLVPED